VGLNPWGEQVLYRLKHHALSAFNSGAAGLLCPHPECCSLGRIDFYHIFCSCPAAAKLRKVLYRRWHTPGVAGGDLEQEIFSLQLTALPPALLQAMGSLLAGGLDDTSCRIGDAVERIIAQCWSVDAATYLHCGWKWHIVHFDHHEATSSDEHLATIATRMRRNHRTIVHQVLRDPHEPTMMRLRRGICQLLGGTDVHNVDVGTGADRHVIVFIAGRAKDASSGGAAGIMIAATQQLTRRFRLLYLQGIRLEGCYRNGEAATHTGLLHGLRVCQRRWWHQVHVVGDDTRAIRQQGMRLAP
jgi:hypothetical protein